MQLVVWWEVLVNEAQEKFAYFCENLFTTWVVKSNDLSFALLRVVFLLFLFLECQLVVVTYF